MMNDLLGVLLFALVLLLGVGVCWPGRRRARKKAQKRTYIVTYTVSGLEKWEIDHSRPNNLARYGVFVLSHLMRRKADVAPVVQAHGAEEALDFLAALLPKRIANEEIGDALELIARLRKERRPKWFIHTKVATTYFWVLWHTGLHYAERAAGIWATATGKGKDKK